MRHKYIVYCLIVGLFCSLGSWAHLARSAFGGGSGNSWLSGIGYSGGGFATGGAGGHK